MTDLEIAYVTREAIKRALQATGPAARDDSRVDACILAASRDAEGLTHRTFYPWSGTRYFDWPDRSQGSTFRLWLGGSEIYSLTTLTAGGTAITDYFLEPNRYGPPYDRIEVNRSTVGSFTTGSTAQRDIAATGVFCGGPVRDLAAATLASGINASDTGLTVSNGAQVGVGSLLLIDSERLQVTARSPATTTATTTAQLSNSKAETTVPVSSGALVGVGEVITIDSERMLVLDIAGNNLTVQRAWDGTVLATHLTSSTVYASRALIVTRGACGTVAATHSTSATISAFQYPSLLQEYVSAAAMVMLEQGSAAYARVAGSADNAQQATERPLTVLGQRLARVLGRTGRTGAI